MKGPVEPIKERVQREKDAYNEGRVFEESSKLHRLFLHVFNGPNSAYGETAYGEAVGAAVDGGLVLDYGCFEGDHIPALLKTARPTKVIGIDISDNAIAEAKKKHGDKAEFHVMDGHHLEFPDQTFDAVVGRSILHHLEFERAIAEMKRVLKPGGSAIFIEPLRDNPAAKLFRALTPKARTKDELPLSRRQIQWANGRFGGNENIFYNFVSIPAGMVSSFLFKNPNNILMKIAHQLDLVIAKTPFRYWMRLVVLVWKVPGSKSPQSVGQA